MELAEHLFKQESDIGKEECLYEAMRLCNQIANGYGLGEPYYLVLDNDVLNALQKPNKYPVRYIALILLFRKLKNLNEDFRITVNPVIFFEFNGEKSFQSDEAFKAGWHTFRRAVYQTGLPIYSYNLDTFKGAKAQFKSIKHDIKIIKNALEQIKATDWKVNLRSGNLVTFPHVISEERCPRVKTKYFSIHHTRLFLKSVIESRIVHHKENDKFARKNFCSKDVVNKSHLLKNKKGQLKGIGDLSLISLCDIGSQFHNQSDSTTIALTFDKTLEKALSQHSQIGIMSQPLVGGQEDKNSITEKLSDFHIKGQVLTDINKQADLFMSDFWDELKNTSWLEL